jgi:hypothetical protein
VIGARAGSLIGFAHRPIEQRRPDISSPAATGSTVTVQEHSESARHFNPARANTDSPAAARRSTVNGRRQERVPGAPWEPWPTRITSTASCERRNVKAVASSRVVYESDLISGTGVS